MAIKEVEQIITNIKTVLPHLRADVIKDVIRHIPSRVDDTVRCIRDAERRMLG